MIADMAMKPRMLMTPTKHARQCGMHPQMVSQAGRPKRRLQAQATARVVRNWRLRQDEPSGSVNHSQ